MSDTPAPARPSASVVIIRDGDHSLEYLLLRRNDKIAFHGGAWVFAGGRVDDADQTPAGLSELDVAKNAAVREAMEETGLSVSATAMTPFAHWTTPVQLPKRFATWFFVAPVSGNPEVRIDNSEIVDFQWLSADAALAMHHADELTLPGPTYVTLTRFRELASSTDMHSHLKNHEIQTFVPRIAKIDGGRCAIYSEDAGYEAVDMDAPGARHRLLMRGQDFDYQRDF